MIRSLIDDGKGHKYTLLAQQAITENTLHLTLTETDATGATVKSFAPIDWPIKNGEYPSILEIMEKFGLDWPYSCRAGACTSCLCRVGGLDQKKALKQDTLGEPIIEIEPEEFLTCIGGFFPADIKDSAEHVVFLTVQYP